MTAFSSEKRGFTLIELLIAVVVIGILLTGLITILNPAAQIQETRDAQRKADLAQIQVALELYYQYNRVYPRNYSATDFRIKGLDGKPVDWGLPWTPYIDIVPKDPVSAKKYVYVSSSGQSYYIYANLERGGNDLQVCSPDGAPCPSAVTNNVPAACGGNCNYGVSSRNVSL